MKLETLQCYFTFVISRFLMFVPLLLEAERDIANEYLLRVA